MSKVVFSLTEHQAAALREIAAGTFACDEADRFRARLVTVLVNRGLADRGNGVRLTPLGVAACALADKLAQRPA